MKSRKQYPCFLEELARKVIRPTLKKSGIEWHVWRAFRRGPATNLNRLGVPDEVNQAILRRSNVGVTQGSYIKAIDSDTVKAMKKLEHAINMQLEATNRKSTGWLPIM
ncbi:MAG: hypothetical protein ABSD13_17160 [Candidatus Korobacteraceae bacterium]|jgi:hypothetical protein